MGRLNVGNDGDDHRKGPKDRKYLTDFNLSLSKRLSALKVKDWH
jgi:hypothetical protein